VKESEEAMRRGLGGWICLLTAAVLAWTGPAQAEPKTVRLAKQFGISYLPLTIMEELKLLEKHASRLGLEVKTEWVRFTGGTPMNEALVSGNLDFASGGIGPLITLWGKTRGNLGVRGVTAINAMPQYLNTINPNVRSVRDFTESDRIALPAVRTSLHAVLLQMAAEKAFGKGNHKRLDPLTVSMSHPDGLSAMLSGRSEITAHFTAAPYMYEELKDPRARKVTDSYEILGGPHTFIVVWASGRFADENPRVMQAFLSAVEEALDTIKTSPAEMAALWVGAEKSKLVDTAAAEMLITMAENEWTMTPKNSMAFATFMHEVGLIPARPQSWKDLFFEGIHDKPGS
jgi:NitT/TauT family transport system substrate-binding protein